MRLRVVVIGLGIVVGGCGKSHPSAPHDGAIADGGTADAVGDGPELAPLPDAVPPTAACAGITGLPGVPEVPLPGPLFGYSFEDLALGDLDGDGKLDLVIAFNVYQLDVALGHGDGTFGPPAVYPTEQGARAIHVVDVNGDGKRDVVVLNSFNKDVGIYLNQGSGVLAAQVTYPAGANPQDLALGDLNGDGFPDVAVFSTQGTASVLLNDGSGAFGAAANYAGTPGGGIAIGDMDQDGDQDVVVGQGTGASVYMNAGSGVLQAAQTYTTGGGGFQVALADMTGDGKLDVVLRHGNVITVAPNTGTGALGAGATYSVSDQGKSLFVTDMNGDGVADVVVDDTLPAQVEVLLGQGGGLATPRAYFADVAAMTIGDVNGDGHPDVLTGYEGARLLLNRGDGTFPGFPIVSLPALANGWNSLQVADVDRDGDLDLITSRFNTLVVTPNAGAGSFSSSVTYTTSTSGDVSVGDLDGDTWPDLVIGGNPGSDTQVLLNTGSGTYATPTTITMSHHPTGMVLVDLDRDGHLDLVTASILQHDVEVQRGDGHGSFSAPVVYPASEATYLAVADLDHDGWADVVVGSGGTEIGVLRNLGYGMLAPEVVHDVAGRDKIAIADVNHDGNPDVVTSVSVSLGQGDGTFMPPITIGGYVDSSENSITQVAVRDMNGDGNVDIVETAGFVVFVFFGHGDGTFDPALWYPTAGAARLAIGDLDGDSRPDIATIDTPITILPNTCMP